MVHTRLNEKEPNPNPHINFISALPDREPTKNDSARQVLRALAAQVRPVMKAHGFSVNSLEEYEHNIVFAGRNWNAGETIELVLRRPDGTFLPTFWLMSTLCHELAHIKHMNHGHAFQALWKKLNVEVQSLQDKGYYGDGYWSSGTRLLDSARVAGEGITAGDLPEYVCGGAQSRRRPTGFRQRRARKSLNATTFASQQSGRQTQKPRKAGMRVKSTKAFIGEGATLVERDREGKIRGKGTGFGKQASSKRARDERILAIERRLRVLEGQRGASTSTLPSLSEPQSGLDLSELDGHEDEEEAIDETDYDRRQIASSSERDNGLRDKSDELWESTERFQHAFDISELDGHEDEEEAIDETDYDRQQTLLSSEQDNDLQNLKSSKLWESIESFHNASKGNKTEVKGSPGCDIPAHSESIGTSGNTTNSLPNTKRKRSVDDELGVTKKPTTRSPSAPLGIGKIVQSEIALRKKESLGMAPVKGGGRTTGSYTRESDDALGLGVKIAHITTTHPQWSCFACTFLNEADHLACSICATPRAEGTFGIRESER